MRIMANRRGFFGLVGASLFAGCAQSPSSTGSPQASAQIQLPFNSWHLALSQDGKSLAVGTKGAIAVWDTEDGKASRAVPGNGVIASHPQKSMWALGGRDAVVRLVDPKDGRVVRELKGHRETQVMDSHGGISAVGFSLDGSQLASAGKDGHLRLWDVESGKSRRDIDLKVHRPTSVAFNSDGTRVAVVSTSRPVLVFDTQSGKLVRELTECPEQGYGVAWSSDGAQLAVGSACFTGEHESSVHLFDATTLKHHGTVPGANQPHDIRYSPDGRWLAFSVPSEKQVRIWSVGSSAESRVLTGHADSPHAIAFSIDSRTLWSVSDREGVFAWDVESGKHIKTFELPN